jgi:hypothetical protein
MTAGQKTPTDGGLGEWMRRIKVNWDPGRRNLIPGVHVAQRAVVCRIPVVHEGSGGLSGCR